MQVCCGGKVECCGSTCCALGKTCFNPEINLCCTPEAVECNGTCCEPGNAACRRTCCDPVLGGGGTCIIEPLAQPCSFDNVPLTMSACPGAIVTYPVTLCNNGACDATYQVSWSPAFFVGGVSVFGPSSIAVAGGGCSTFDLTVIAHALTDPMLTLDLTLTAENRGGETCGAATVTQCSAIIPIDILKIQLDFGSVTEQNELDPGGFLCLNDDDDNGNDVPDKDETGSTAGEDDLVPLTITADGTLQGTLTLSAAAGAGRIKLYENADRSLPVTLPQTWQLGGLPKTFFVTYYVEGVDTSESATNNCVLPRDFTVPGSSGLRFTRREG